MTKSKRLARRILYIGVPVYAVCKLCEANEYAQALEYRHSIARTLSPFEGQIRFGNNILAEASRVLKLLLPLTRLQNVHVKSFTSAESVLQTRTTDLGEVGLE